MFSYWIVIIYDFFLHDSCFLFTAGQLIIMVTASVVQVMTIRHLFGDQSAKSHNMKLAT